MNINEAQHLSEQLDIKLEVLNVLPKNSKGYNKVRKEAQNIAKKLKIDFLGLTYE